jgi:predicted MFS family arabinose efflux permease
MVISQVIQGVVYGAASFVIVFKPSYVLFVVLACIGGVCTAVYITAENAVLPRLADSIQLPKALTLSNARHSFASLSGGPTGGVLLSASTWLPLFANFIGSIIGAVTAGLIRKSGGTKSVRIKPWTVTETFDGFTNIIRTPPIRSYAIVSSLNSLGGGAIVITLPIYWADKGLDAEVIGIFTFTFASAGLVGAVLAAPIVAKFRPFFALTFGLAVWSTASVVACLDVSDYVVVTVFCAASLVTPVMTTPMTAWIARSVPDHLLGRTQSALWVLIRLLGAAAPGAGGWLLAQSRGASAAFIPFAIVQIVVLLCCLTSRHLRSIPSSAPQVAGRFQPSP